MLPGAGGGGHYLIMSFAARWTAREPVLNDEHDDFKWLAPDGLGDLKVTGGLLEVIEAARNAGSRLDWNVPCDASAPCLGPY